jgi:hypothetical protein
MPLTRRYDIAWMTDEGEIREATKIAPAIPVFEAAFSAFGRGVLFTAPHGQIAIEDLMPGDIINTPAGPRPVKWIGAITLPPSNLKQENGPDTYRVSTGAFGADIPRSDMVLSSAARILQRAPVLLAKSGGESALVPIRDFADDDAVIEITPMAPVRVYHLAMEEHTVLDVNGVPIESFHPGRNVIDQLPGELLGLYAALFPHVVTLSGFGPLFAPRLDRAAIAAIAAA